MEKNNKVEWLYTLQKLLSYEFKWGRNLNLIFSNWSHVAYKV